MPVLITHEGHAIFQSLHENIVDSTGLFILVESDAEGDWGLFCLVKGKDNYEWHDICVARLKGSGEVRKLGVVRNEQ